MKQTWNIKTTFKLSSSFNNLSKEFSRKWTVFKSFQKKVLNEIWRDTVETLVKILPKNTWKLAWSIKYKTVKWWNWISVYSTSKYAIFLEEWTKAHMIKPKNAKALHWKNNFSKWHMVKWIKAWNYFKKVMQSKKRQLWKYWLKIVDWLLKTR